MKVQLDVPDNVVLYNFIFVNRDEVKNNNDEQLKELIKVKSELCEIGTIDLAKKNKEKIEQIRNSRKS